MVTIKKANKAQEEQEETKKKEAAKKEKKVVKKTTSKTEKVEKKETKKVVGKTVKKEAKKDVEKPAAEKKTVKKTVEVEAKNESQEEEVDLKKLVEDIEDLGDDEEDEDKKKNQPPNENNPDEVLARKVIESTLGTAVKTKDLKKITKDPESMADLLEMTGYELQGLKKGQEVNATITDKSKRSVFFDIGAKTEGLLIEKEMEHVKDYIDFLRPGDTVKTVVVSPENEKGQILLSLRRAAMKWKWELFTKYLETEEPIEVRGLDINRGGMIARVLNVHGFIPVSQFGRQWIGKLDQLYNKVFPVRIIEVDQEKNRLIFSEKSVSESDIIEQQHQLLKLAEPGKVYKGEVSGVMPFGIFVRVFLSDEDREAGSFLDGLVHISEISWEKVTDVSKMFEVDQLIDVQVIDADENSGKLNLSIKRLTINPWDEIAKSLPVETKTTGEITRLAPYGAFVKLEQGIEGLIHISKIPSDADLKLGDTVNVYIESIDTDHHRISLGLVLSAKPVGYK